MGIKLVGYHLFDVRKIGHYRCHDGAYFVENKESSRASLDPRFCAHRFGN